MIHRALFLTVVAGVAMASVAASAQTNSFNNNQDSFNNNTCVAFGQGATVVCGDALTPPIYSDGIAAQLVAAMPDKAKSVAIESTLDSRSLRVSAQYQQYITAHGYKVSRINSGQTAIGGVPPRPITLMNMGNEYLIAVRPVTE